MEKVPVGRSISHAYEFLFGRIFQIIGTAWLPALLYATACYFFLQNAVTWLAPLTHDQAALTRGIAAAAGFGLVALVIRAVLGISLTQEALGIRHDILLAHFVVGPRETRLIFAQLRLLVLTLVLYAVTLAVIVLGIGAAIKYGPMIPHVPMVGGKSLVLIGAVIVAGLLYIAFALTVLKLNFLLNAVASVERHASIRRGWRLARGSGWRILAVLLSVLLPVAILAWGGMYFAFGGEMAAVSHAAPGVPRLHALLQLYADHALVIAVIAGIGAMVGGALLAGATAAAYRTVTGHEEAEPEDDDALVAPLLAPAHGHSDEPLPPVPDHGHGGHDSHGGHDDHGHGGHDDHGHKDHGHDEGHGDGHGHGGHDEAHGHGGSHDSGHGHDDDDADDDAHDDGHGHDDGHAGNGHGHGHDDHGHGHDDHGHKSHDDHHGHDDHGHGGHGHGSHHAKAA
jgi:hypothetical protein